MSENWSEIMNKPYKPGSGDFVDFKALNEAAKENESAK